MPTLLPSNSLPPTESLGRRQRKRQQTADHLANTAWELFVAQGFDTVTMEAIADAADVAKGTLYKHFPVKEALLRHRFHRELAEELPALLAQLAALPTVAERLKRFFLHSAGWSETHRDYLRHYVRFRLGEVGTTEASNLEGRSGLDRLFADFIAAGQESGELRAGQDPVQLAHYLQFLHLSALLRWLNLPGIDLRTEFATMLDLFLSGLETRR